MIFLIISVIIFNIMAYKIPKRISRLEMYASSFFALFFALIVDVYLDLKLDWYGYFEKGVQWGTLIGILGLYPSVNIIILNYYPFAKNVKSKALYILGWSIFLVLYEWMSIKAGFFYHNEWELWYSAVCYPFIIFILAWNLSFLRRLNKYKD